MRRIHRVAVLSDARFVPIDPQTPTTEYIDTAMVIIPYNLCKNITWINDKYEADGHYITECYNTNKNNHIYVDNDLCYYNKLGRNL